MNLSNSTIGTDIELFVQNRESGEIVSAEGYAKGTKRKPFVFDKKNQYFATSLDNVLYEFCVPPAQTKQDFLANIKKSMEFVNSQLPSHLCSVSLASSFLNDRWLNTRNARLFGCERDYNAWTGTFNPPPMPGGNLRSAGFHVHVGNPDIHPVLDSVVKAMDLFLGVPSILIDEDTMRRQLYGKCGSFRPKPYGLEYRVLSSFFSSNDRLIEWVYENTQAALNFVNSGNTVEDYLPAIIDSNNSESAKALVNKYNIPLP